MSFNNNRYQFTWLALIFIFNFLFKLIFISSSSLWYDEIISVQDTLLDFGHIKHEAEWDKNPPFYHYVLWVWSKLFGISEFGVRSMSAFFSSITAVMIFIFMNKISTQRSAIAASVIFTFHPFLYYYAQEARCFSFLIFLVTLNLFVIRSFVIRPNYVTAFLLGVVNFLIFYTHYLAGLILFCQFIFFAVIFRKKIIFLLIIYITPVLLVLLRFTRKQYNVLFFSQKMSEEKKNVPLATFDYLLEALDQLFVSRFFCVLFLIALFIFLYKVIRRQEIEADKNLQLKLYIIFAPLICILILYFLGMWTNVFHGRYLIFTLPYIIFSFFILIEQKIIIYGFTLVCLLFEIYGLKFKESRGMDYRFCAVLTKEIQKKGDVIVLLQTHDIVNLYTYYYDRDIFYSKERMSHEFLSKRNIFYIRNVDDLRGMNLDAKKPILFFQTYQKVDDNISILQFFESKKYFRFTSNQIEGVRFTYLKK